MSREHEAKRIITLCIVLPLYQVFRASSVSVGGSDIPKAHPAQCQENQGFSSFDTSVGNPAFKRGLSGTFYRM